MWGRCVGRRSVAEPTLGQSHSLRGGNARLAVQPRSGADEKYRIQRSLFETRFVEQTSNYWDPFFDRYPNHPGNWSSCITLTNIVNKTWSVWDFLGSQTVLPPQNVFRLQTPRNSKRIPQRLLQHEDVGQLVAWLVGACYRVHGVFRSFCQRSSPTSEKKQGHVRKEGSNNPPPGPGPPSFRMWDRNPIGFIDAEKLRFNNSGVTTPVPTSGWPLATNGSGPGQQQTLAEAIRRRLRDQAIWHRCVRAFVLSGWATTEFRGRLHTPAWSRIFWRLYIITKWVHSIEASRFGFDGATKVDHVDFWIPPPLTCTALGVQLAHHVGGCCGPSCWTTWGCGRPTTCVASR